MNKKHLGTSSELCWFAMQMAEELEKHQKEKLPLREVDYNHVENLVINEIRQRIDLISKSNLTKEEKEKQCVHIANYSMMLFLRSKYNV